MKVELDLSNYATKAGLKTATGVNTSKFSKKVDLANLKSNVNKLDIDTLKNFPTNLSNLKSKVDELDVDKLVPGPIDLSKLSNVVKNDVVKKDVYNAKIKNVEDKIPDGTNLATKTTLNAKVNEVKGKIPNITNLATTSALTTVENKIPGFSSLVKKTDCNTKIDEIEKKITGHSHHKYIITTDFDKFTAEVFDIRLKREILASKNATLNFVNKTDFDNKLKEVTSNKIKLNVKAILTKGLTKDLIDKFSIFNAAKHFSLEIF